MKLTDIQRHKLRESLRNSESVLSEIKLKQLKGKELKDMKTLEEVVQITEILLM